MKLSSMTRGLLFFFLAIAIAGSPLAAGTGQASEETQWEAGAQGGLSFNSKDESFTQYEALLNYKLPWRWKWDGVIDVGTRLTSSLGALRGGGETGAIGTLGFGFVFGDGHDFRVRAGSALTGMTKKQYGDEDFGTYFQFTSYIGMAYTFWDELSAHVRVQHMSNASLSGENPGLNMIMFGLSYAF
ncbi:MAG: acyloxyacyl hydrolase [Desulfosarcina sp.]|nr:acyloxyacyl hydrolase [Desulfobacterales bacterium]